MHRYLTVIHNIITHYQKIVGNLQFKERKMTMKTIICYASKTGTTEKCAEKLKAIIGKAEICDIGKDSPNLSEYDCIIIGGSIRMGHLHKAARKLIQKNKNLLMTKKIAFFICNGFPEQTESFLLQNIDQSLLEHAVCSASFGGEVNLGILKGMDKFIAKAVMNMMRNTPDAKPEINEDSIREFAQMLQNQI